MDGFIHRSTDTSQPGRGMDKLDHLEHNIFFLPTTFVHIIFTIYFVEPFPYGLILIICLTSWAEHNHTQDLPKGLAIKHSIRPNKNVIGDKL